MEKDEKLKKLKKQRLADILFLVAALVNFIGVFFISLLGKESGLIWSGICWLVIGVIFIAYRQYRLSQLNKKLILHKKIYFV
ncbi:hypothetical protein [Campylobacter estrildidarum]|uniref:Uncharacterized protein n=1 Tax=Campylobacter estrildidarum TaxID=2510189 RepID=A0A4U7BTD1_9BACT|nr:hypothetical protein [Campylobacter estrildidarum]TKX31567.1 hypothetical protein CQA69_02815 [Campylobacter estrildidarum]